MDMDGGIREQGKLGVSDQRATRTRTVNRLRFICSRNLSASY